MHNQTASLVLYVSPEGDDNYSGLVSDILLDRTDGPLATLEAAITCAPEIRRIRNHSGTVVIRLREGIYRLGKPLVFGREHENVSIEAFPGEQPVIEGAKLINNWKETTVNGLRAWAADVSETVRGKGPFRTLWVNGRRANRARWPREGWLAMKAVPGMPTDAELFHPCDCIEAFPGDLPDEIVNAQDAELIVPHFWIQERLPLESVDLEQRLIRTAKAGVFRFTDDFNGDLGKRYCLENVKEGLLNPGDWYLDLREGIVTYIPLDNETLDTTEILMPTLYQFVRAHADIDAEERIRGLHFQGLTFRYSDWRPAEGTGVWYDPYEPPLQWRPRESLDRFRKNQGPMTPEAWSRRNVSPQSDIHIPGVISFRGACGCSVKSCCITETGYYGIDLGEACANNRIVGNRMENLGAGGIKADGSGPSGKFEWRTRANLYTDNTIGHIGKVFPAGVGIITMFSSDNRIEHNHVHHTQYSGISVGWTWGFGETVSGGNIIGHNLVEHIGVGLLSDMAGIYLLGIQPGTFVRGNIVRHVSKYSYGGNGIYPDEGSSFMVIENNLVERAGSHGFNEHWGRQNIVRNNVFAYADNGCVNFARERSNGWVTWPAPGACFEHNICVSAGEPFFGDAMTFLDTGVLRSSQNLFLQTGEQNGTLWQYEPWPQYNAQSRSISLEELQTDYDLETGSIETREPVFADPQNGDFTVINIKLVKQIGFKPLDWTEAGPRPPEKRVLPVLGVKGVGPVFFGD